MNFQLGNSSNSPATGTQSDKRQMRRELASVALPTPLETTGTAAHTLKRAGSSAAQPPAVLSAQTVTTTTVTTTTVTTYPPLKLPRVRRSKIVARDMYPLADSPAPPALEQFALDINGEQLYFSQGEAGEEILASIAGEEAHGRAMTPQDTQDTAPAVQHALSAREGYVQEAAQTAFARDAAQTLYNQDAGPTLYGEEVASFDYPRRSSCGSRSSVAGDDAGSGDDAALPSPLLSPRAGPAEAPRELGAVYSMPRLLSTYDGLPPAVQTYVLFQLLRRTPRPALQFAAQTVAPVLQRDFVGELPHEVAHHVLRFMGVRELNRAACVSRRWQSAVDGDRSVWRARLADARYAQDTPRVHPLCLTHFGLARTEPERPTTAPRPTEDEMDLAHLAPRPPNQACAAAASRLRERSHDTTGNVFKEAYRKAYLLDRAWAAGASRQLSFACDGGAVVTCVQLTDEFIVAGFDTKHIYVFDVTTGAVVRRLEGHDGGVWALAVVGDTVVSGSTDRTVRVWDLRSGRCTHVFAGHSSTVRCLQVALPADVRSPAERASGAPVRYEPREPLIVTGSRDTTLRVWRLPSPTADVEEPPVTAAVEDRMMDVDDVAMTDAPPAADPPMAEAQASRPRASRPRGDAPSPFLQHALEGHAESVRAVAANGNIIVSGSYDCSVRVWDATSGACLHRLEGHTSKVYTIVLDPDHHAIFSGSMDGMIRVWDWRTGACLRILRGHLTLVGLLALRHGTLVSAGADTTLRVWDHPLQAARTQPTTQQRAFSDIPGDDVPYSPPPVPGATALATHALAAVAHHAAANLQQLHLLQQLQLQQRANDHLQPPPLDHLVRPERHVLRQHSNAITCFQHDGTKIVSGADSTLKLWDLRSGRFVRNLLDDLTSVWQVRFDNRRCVAAVNRNNVTCFEVMDFGP